MGTPNTACTLVFLFIVIVLFICIMTVNLVLPTPVYISSGRLFVKQTNIPTAWLEETAGVLSPLPLDVKFHGGEGMS